MSVVHNIYIDQSKNKYHTLYVIGGWHGPMLFQRCLPSQYAGQVKLATAKHWQFMPK